MSRLTITVSGWGNARDAGTDFHIPRKTNGNNDENEKGDELNIKPDGDFFTWWDAWKEAHEHCEEYKNKRTVHPLILG